MENIWEYIQTYADIDTTKNDDAQDLYYHITLKLDSLFTRILDFCDNLRFLNINDKEGRTIGSRTPYYLCFQNDNICSRCAYGISITFNVKKK